MLSISGISICFFIIIIIIIIFFFFAIQSFSRDFEDFVRVNGKQPETSTNKTIVNSVASVI